MSDRPLDLVAIRNAAKKSVSHPDWLKEGELVYSLRYKRNLKVTGILGDRVFLKLEDRIVNEPLSDITHPILTNNDGIDCNVINHTLYRSIASDYVEDLAAIRISDEIAPLFCPIPKDIDKDLAAALSSLGIKQFYSHQVQSWEILKADKSIAIVTPTASGKSMAFMPKVFHEAIANKRTSLLIYPLKALAADQYGKLKEINDRLPQSKQLFIAKCTGDVPREVRRQYFQGGRTPDIIAASPDVLHYLLAHTNNYKMGKFGDFLARLSTVVCDESHTYISSFGIHFANLMRRLRLAVHNKAGNLDRLSWVIATATIANPLELAATFSGVPQEELTLIDKSGAKVPERSFLIMKPQSASNFMTAHMVRNFLAYDIKGLVFVNSRRTAKSIFSILQMQMGASMWGVELFYGSLTPAARSRLINRLSNGSLKIIITTSALEAGIDLPSLDFVILKGTTSLNSLWQRAGRAGRSSPGLVVLIPDLSNHIDYYYAKQPDRLFEKSELVKLQPNYPNILAKHLLCAGAEGGIHHKDVPLFFGKNSDYIAAELVKQKQLFCSSSGSLLFEGYPHKDVSLRGITGDRIQLIDLNTAETLEELSLDLAHREAFTNAVYITTEEGQTVAYRCKKLDVNEKTASLERMKRQDLRTVPSVEIKVTPEKLLEEPLTINTSIESANMRLSLWWMTISEVVSGYKENKLIYGPICRNSFCELYKLPQNKERSKCPCCGNKLKKSLVERELKEVNFNYELVTSYSAPILKIEINNNLAKEIVSKVPSIRKQLLNNYGPNADSVPPIAASVFEVQSSPVALALHSLSHMLIKAIPLTFLASDKDVNSLVENRTYMGNNNAHRTIVYLYDTVPEGCGTTEAIFTEWDEIIREASNLASICDCGDLGCPRCLTLHGCPEMNRGLSKLLGMSLLEMLV